MYIEPACVYKSYLFLIENLKKLEKHAFSSACVSVRYAYVKKHNVFFFVKDNFQRINFRVLIKHFISNYDIFFKS